MKLRSSSINQKHNSTFGTENPVPNTKKDRMLKHVLYEEITITYPFLQIS